MKQKLLNSIRLRALMLVAVMCAAFAGQAWGAENDTHDFSQDFSKLLNNNASIDPINIAAQSYPVKKVIVSYRYNKTLTNAVTVEVTVNGVSWGSKYVEGTGSNYSTLEFSGDAVTGAVALSFTNNTGDGTGHGTFYVNNVQLVEGASAAACATPTFSPSAGTYGTAQNVTITTATEGATIYYTTDGATPTTSSSLYSSAITVSETQTIKAIAVKDGLDDSSVASATYTIVNLTHAGTEQDPYSVADARTAIDADYGMTSKYATGIVSEIVTAYNSDYGNITFDMIDQGGSNTLRAYRCTGTDASDVTVGDVVVVSGDLVKYGDIYEFSQGCELVSLVRKPAAPTFSPAAGAVVSGTPVALACLTDGATIYYTTDGSTPTTSSSEYSSAITVTEDMTIKAISVKDEQSSDVAEAAYTIALPVATPTFSPAAGTYSSAQSVTISTETADATIYYSYDNESWTEYTAALNIAEDKTVYAKAEKTGMVTSAVASAEFAIHIPSITFGDATPKNLTYEAQNSDVAFTSEYTSGTLAAVLCDSEGNTTTYDWFSAAIVGDAVRVTVTKNEDTENGRTAYFKVTADNATSAVFSVVQAKFVADYATLPFEWAGGTSSDLDAVTGVTAYGIGDYAAGNAPYRVRMDGVGDYILIKTDGQPGVVSVGVKMIGGGTTSKIKVQQSADGTNFTDVEELTISGSQNDVVNLATTNAFNSASRYVKIIKSVHATGGNIGVGPISIAKASTEPAIVAESSVDLDDTATSGEITYSINNPNGSSLTAASSTDWISDITVTATKVTFTTTANTGAERVGTITLSYEGADDKVITVTQAEYVVELTYNLVSSITSGKHYIISYGNQAMGVQNENNRAAVSVTNSNDKVTFDSNAGVAEFIIYGPDADGLYTIYDASENGYLYAASSTKNYLRTQTDIDNNARWEITFDAENDFASIVAEKSSNNKVMQYNSSNTIFSCYGSASQTDIYLYEKDGEATPTESVTVTDAGYATYVSDNALDFTGSSINAYIAEANGTTGVTFTQINKVPANTGVLLYKDGGATVSIPTLTGAATDVSGNVFLRGTGAAVASVDGSLHNYILNKPSEKPIGFYRAAGQTVAKNRAYIQIDESTPVKGFIALPGSEETAVKTVKAEAENGVIFNLAGQRIQKLQRGINIVNGRKIVVK